MITPSAVIGFSLLFLFYSVVLWLITVLGMAAVTSVPPALQQGTGRWLRLFSFGWILLGYLILLVLILP